MKLVAFKQVVSLFVFALMLAVFQPAAFAEEAPAAQSEVVVNVNTASAAELAEALDGIGPSKAGDIVAHRDANGPYGTVEDLLQVKGIGEATLDKNRHKIKLN